MTYETRESTSIETTTKTDALALDIEFQRHTIERLMQQNVDLTSALQHTRQENSLLRHLELHIRQWLEGETEFDHFQAERIFVALDSIRG